MAGYGATTAGSAGGQQRLGAGDFDPLLNAKQQTDSAGPAHAPSQPTNKRRNRAADAGAAAADDDRNEPWSAADWCVSGCSALVAAGVLGLSGWMLSVGLENDSTDCEKPLWVWLVVCGAYFGGVILFYAIGLVAYSYYEKRGAASSRLVYCCDELFLPLIVKVLSFLFGCAWLIVGSVWTYGIDADDTHCPDALYQLCWYYLTVAWGVIGSGLALFLVGFTCVSLYWYCSGRKPRTAADG